MIFVCKEKQAKTAWNTQIDKPIEFLNDQYETEDEFTISLLKKQGYTIKETKKTSEDSKKKPGRPKAKKD